MELLFLNKLQNGQECKYWKRCNGDVIERKGENVMIYTFHKCD